MRLEFLLLVAAAFPSCLSRTEHDSGRDSIEDSPRDSIEDSPRDSIEDSPLDRPRDRPRDSPRDSPRDRPRDSPRDSPRDRPRDSPRDSPRDPGPSPRLLPAPLVLQLPPEPGPPRIRCLAPRRFPGSTFELLQGIPGIPVRSFPAAPDQHWAEFSLPGAPRCFRCRYRSHNGSAWLESELSPGIGSDDLGDAECPPGATGPPPTAGTLRNDPSWLLPVSLGVAVPGLLLLLLGAAAVAWRGLWRRRGRSHTVSAPSLPMAPVLMSPSR